MALNDPVSLTQATALGRRAGQAFRVRGTPTRNPFSDATQPNLAQAWRRAYLEAQSR